MTLNITWHAEALAEFDADIDWYDGREPGLGDRFESAVLGAVDAAVGTPEAWPKWPGWDRDPIVRSGLLARANDLGLSRRARGKNRRH